MCRKAFGVVDNGELTEAEYPRTRSDLQILHTIRPFENLFYLVHVNKIHNYLNLWHMCLLV